jgi:hypothetical protein
VQLLVNQVQKAGASLADIDLLVLDECHHCRWGRAARGSTAGCFLRCRAFAIPARS